MKAGLNWMYYLNSFLTSWMPWKVDVAILLYRSLSAFNHRYLHLSYHSRREAENFGPLKLPIDARLYKTILKWLIDVAESKMNDEVMLFTCTGSG